MKVCITRAASIEALKKASRFRFGCGRPRAAQIRSSRSASAQKTRNTGAEPIHGIEGTRSAMRRRLSAACTITTLAC
jgi:hypothetical protein